MQESRTRRVARQSAQAQVAFTRNLAAVRDGAGLSQAQLAALMGVDATTVAGMERLDSDPRLSQLRQYLTACGASLLLAVVPASLE